MLSSCMWSLSAILTSRASEALGFLLHNICLLDKIRLEDMGVYTIQRIRSPGHHYNPLDLAVSDSQVPLFIFAMSEVT